MNQAGFKRLSSIVAGFRGRKIAVFGDMMLDRYIKGSVKRISPEAPVPVVRVTSESTVCGGSANVAVNIAALGAVPSLISVTGKDAAAAEFRALLGKSGISPAFLIRDENFPTIEKTARGDVPVMVEDGFGSKTLEDVIPRSFSSGTLEKPLPSCQAQL